MLHSFTRPRRLLAIAALIGAGALAPLQPSASAGGPPAAALASDACGAAIAKADGGAWQCTFVDEFGGSELDGSKWLLGETAWTGFWTGQTCFVRSAKNVAVRRGSLQLTTRREPKPFLCQSPSGSFTTQYTGGHVATRDRFAQTYGRFEVRAQYPASTTAGVHGGFWMYPATHAYGAWPASGEIDVAEWWSSDPGLVMPSLHYPGRNFFADSGWGCRVADATQWHTYTVEWGTDEMRFFIDGSMCWRRSWTPDHPLVAPQPFDQPFNLVLTMGVGEGSGTNVVSPGTQLPATYVIDYVKAWR